ncbi:hypothetical protein H310_05971 [Aphanomyces invadans]|uniref:Uncharacterized protein n=1 Tax=Aphanomyces invadans TaxID=157072 RepID=A0A024U9C0_9STRA|nr:hypothetical protein H310_05971 [Aphanomyces invadans]ETW02462.1 hypothetical protein H310_05971 [Aphanomyces invadans]|eukprot:XP_008869067.1 hypothetical protein H310_05971 [Aphanomyces invadans]
MSWDDEVLEEDDDLVVAPTAQLIQVCRGAMPLMQPQPTRRTLLVHFHLESQQFLLRDPDEPVPPATKEPTVPTVDRSLPMKATSPVKTLLMFAPQHPKQINHELAPELHKPPRPNSTKKHVHFALQSPKRKRREMSTKLEKTLEVQDKEMVVTSATERVASTHGTTSPTPDGGAFEQTAMTISAKPSDPPCVHEQRVNTADPLIGASKPVRSDDDEVRSILTALVEQAIAMSTPALNPRLAVAMDALESILNSVYEQVESRRRAPGTSTTCVQDVPSTTPKTMKNKLAPRTKVPQPKTAGRTATLESSTSKHESHRNESMPLITLEIEGRWEQCVERLRRDPTLPRPLPRFDWCNSFHDGRVHSTHEDKARGPDCAFMDAPPEYWDTDSDA